MADFVVDANVTVATVLPSDANDYSDRLLRRFESGETGRVPALWHLEVLNALLSRERRKTITREQRDEALDIIRNYPVETDGLSADEATINTVTRLATRHQLTAYDASYLELALRGSLPIVTLDQAIIQAAKAEGVVVL
jgi:predicted nucleic acid-binding protein